MKQVITSVAGTQPHHMLRARTAVAAGSLLAALAASSCCMLPVVLFTLGASGAWIGALVRLAPFQPYFIAATVACLGAGYWLVYRSRAACADVGACRTQATDRLVNGVLVAATALVVLAIAFDLFAPLLSS